MGSFFATIAVVGGGGGGGGTVVVHHCCGLLACKYVAMLELCSASGTDITGKTLSSTKPQITQGYSINKSSHEQTLPSYSYIDI